MKKVQYATFYYENQFGDTSDYLPKHTSRGMKYNPDAPAFNLFTGGIVETMEERAVRCGLKDIWTPVVKLQFAANHSVVYKGERAKSIWKEWNKQQFKKK